MEQLALHRGRLDRGTLVVREPIEAGCQKCLDRGRYREGRSTPTVREQECEHLLHEERVSTRRFDDPPSHRLLDVDRTRQVLQERHALGVGQRFEANRCRVRLPSSPLRTKFEQLGPCDADEQDRRISHPVGYVID